LQPLKELLRLFAYRNGIGDHQAVFESAQLVGREERPRLAADILPLWWIDNLIPATVGRGLWMLDNEDAVGHRNSLSAEGIVWSQRQGTFGKGCPTPPQLNTTLANLNRVLVFGSRLSFQRRGNQFRDFRVRCRAKPLSDLCFEPDRETLKTVPRFASVRTVLWASEKIRWRAGAKHTIWTITPDEESEMRPR